MTLEQKREIVGRFKGGESVYDICLDLFFRTHGAREFSKDKQSGEDVIRDFLNGKFKLQQSFCRTQLRASAPKEGE